jgi:hypothetical protein
MKFSAFDCASVVLLGAAFGPPAVLACIAAGCGSGGGGSVDVSSGPAGPFSGYGSPGRFSAGSSTRSFLGSGGPFSGYGSPGFFSAPLSECSAVCARIAALSCPIVEQPGDQGGIATGSTLEASCALQCTSAYTALKTDCERNLFLAFLQCALDAPLQCGNDGVQVPEGCPLPTSSACRTTTPRTVDAGF